MRKRAWPHLTKNVRRNGRASDLALVDERLLERVAEPLALPSAGLFCCGVGTGLHPGPDYRPDAGFWPDLRLVGEGSHVLADDAQHDFISAAADGTETGVPIHPADGRLVHKAHAAVILEAAVRHFPGETAGFQFCH